MANTTIIAPRGASHTALQSTYLKKLEETTTALLNNYTSIFQAGRIYTEQSEQIGNSKGNLHLDTIANNLLYNSESLLKMINELKHSILVSDFETINDGIDTQIKQYETFSQQVEPVIEKLNAEISFALHELEEESQRT
ncbi:mediator of RNA polymerase II transcription subunit 22 isoform c [Planoprotostelium fungivorum]|uniref:Mediator of RNA polymerase II transcription subunit 22 isoform c n=1 Tax=Planoprotostelium fungivorum TaxID=1890364 RepID=A0A2P6NW03_9EUKA|nr:mediator of RNA polymerase II transcription subunit 22 isoform c [Planoprotostelium fungivorum]